MKKIQQDILGDIKGFQNYCNEDNFDLKAYKAKLMVTYVNFFSVLYVISIENL